MARTPNADIPLLEAGSLQIDAVFNEFAGIVEAWQNCVVLEVGRNAPSGTEVNGNRVIVGTGTGVFTGHDNELAILLGGTWQFYAPPAAGVPIIKNLDDGADWECDDAGVWSAKAVGAGAGGTTIDLVTEASAFTAVAATHAGRARLVLAGGDMTFDNAETYAAGQAFNVRSTAAMELIEDGVTLTPPAGGTLELDADMAVTVVMTSATAGIVIGQTVAA